MLIKLFDFSHLTIDISSSIYLPATLIMSKHGSGRKLDSIWQYFDKSVTPGKTGCRATCKACSKDIQGIPERMKAHIHKCNVADSAPLSDSTLPPEGTVARLTRTYDQMSAGASSPPPVSSLPSVKKQKMAANLGSYVTKTSEREKKALDVQIARLLYATNTPFQFVEHDHFKKLIHMLRPGYYPPSRHAIGGPLLDEVYEDVYASCKEKIEGKTVSMEMDGWSNIHNEPVVCCSVTTSAGDTFLTSTIDTQDNRHTADNLEVLAEAAIKKAEEDLGCKVKSFVTDNAANMKKLRSQLEESLPIISYPCSAHVADRLAKDIDSSDVKADIVAVAKYFRNHHLPNAWYKQAGGKELSIPCQVRWNSVNDCLQAYVDNWATLVTVVEAHREEIDSNICEKVLDINLKHQAMEHLSKMKPIAVALDRLQRDKCHLSDAVVIWKELQGKFDDMSVSLSDLMRFEARMSTTLTPAHYLAYRLDPRYHGSPHLNRLPLPFCSVVIDQVPC